MSEYYNNDGYCLLTLKSVSECSDISECDECEIAKQYRNSEAKYNEQKGEI